MRPKLRPSGRGGVTASTSSGDGELAPALRRPCAGQAILAAREQLGFEPGLGGLQERMEQVNGILAERPELGLERDPDLGMER